MQTNFRSKWLRPIKAAVIALIMSLTWGTSTLATAQEQDVWQIQVSPYTKHYHPSPDHRHVYLVGVEHINGDSKFWGGDQSLWGVSYFSNSFGQPSAYAYGGGIYKNLFGSPQWYFKWTAGVLYGYKPPYQDKVPFNRNGWSPGLIAAVGYKITPKVGVQLNALGTAAAMLAFTYDLP